MSLIFKSTLPRAYCMRRKKKKFAFKNFPEGKDCARETEWEKMTDLVAAHHRKNREQGGWV